MWACLVNAYAYLLIRAHQLYLVFSVRQKNSQTSVKFMECITLFHENTDLTYVCTAGLFPQYNIISTTATTKTDSARSIPPAMSIPWPSDWDSPVWVLVTSGMFLHCEPCIVSISHSISMFSVMLLPLNENLGFLLIHERIELSTIEMFVIRGGRSSKRILIFPGFSGKHCCITSLMFSAENPHWQKLSTPSPIVVARASPTLAVDACVHRPIHFYCV